MECHKLLKLDPDTAYLRMTQNHTQKAQNHTL